VQNAFLEYKSSGTLIIEKIHTGMLDIMLMFET
jgi:hypothetical protein